MTEQKKERQLKIVTNSRAGWDLFWGVDDPKLYEILFPYTQNQPPTIEIFIPETIWNNLTLDQQVKIRTILQKHNEEVVCYFDDEEGRRVYEESKARKENMESNKDWLINITIGNIYSALNFIETKTNINDREVSRIYNIFQRLLQDRDSNKRENREQVTIDKKLLESSIIVKLFVNMERYLGASILFDSPASFQKYINKKENNIMTETKKFNIKLGDLKNLYGSFDCSTWRNYIYSYLTKDPILPDYQLVSVEVSKDQYKQLSARQIYDILKTTHINLREEFKEEDYSWSNLITNFKDEGYSYGSGSGIRHESNSAKYLTHTQITENSAKQIAAFSKCLKIRDIVNGDWKPESNVMFAEITRVNSTMCVGLCKNHFTVMFPFKTKEIAEKVIEQNQKLFEEAFGIFKD